MGIPFNIKLNKNRRTRKAKNGYGNGDAVGERSVMAAVDVSVAPAGAQYTLYVNGEALATDRTCVELTADTLAFAAHHTGLALD